MQSLPHLVLAAPTSETRQMPHPTPPDVRLCAGFPLPLPMDFPFESPWHSWVPGSCARDCRRYRYQPFPLPVGSRPQAISMNATMANSMSLVWSTLCVSSGVRPYCSPRDSSIVAMSRTSKCPSALGPAAGRPPPGWRGAGPSLAS